MFKMLKDTNTLNQPTCSTQNIGNETYIIQQNVDNDHIINVNTQKISPNFVISLV